jgi:cell division protein FtsW
MASVAPREKLPADYILFNVTLALLAIGVVMVFNASYGDTVSKARMNYDPFYFLKRQAVWAAVGFVCMLLVMRIGYWNLRRFAAPLMILAIVGLVAVLIPGIGEVRNGARRWFDIGPLLIQPSEFAKLALVIYLAGQTCNTVNNIRDLKDGFWAALVPICACIILVEKQPDLGTAAVIGLGSLATLFLAGARVRHLAAVLVCGLLLVGFAALRHDYRMDRVSVYLEPDKYARDKGLQITHSLIAVTTGGALGVGLGEGREKLFVPEANTDFIFATIVEETGLWGTSLVVGLMLLLGWAGCLIARRTKDPFGMVLASGLSAMISLQAIINIAVVTNTIPATGVPLPFISAGGSSLVLNMISIGILLNIARHPEPPSSGRRS